MAKIQKIKSKSQMINPKQIPILKFQFSNLDEPIGFGTWLLVFEIYLNFVFWNLIIYIEL